MVGSPGVEGVRGVVEGVEGVVGLEGVEWCGVVVGSFEVYFHITRNLVSSSF